MASTKVIGLVEEVLLSEDNAVAAFNMIEGVKKEVVLMSTDTPRMFSDAVASMLIKVRKAIQEASNLTDRMNRRRLALRVVGRKRNGAKAFTARYVPRRQGAKGIEFLRCNTALEDEVVADGHDWFAFLSNPNDGQFQCIRCTRVMPKNEYKRHVAYGPCN